MNRLKENMRELNGKIEAARTRRDNIIAGSRSAKAQAAAAQAISTASAADPLGKLDQMEQKVQQQVAMAGAYTELNAEENLDKKFQKMEIERSVEDELAALKAKLEGKES